MPFKLTIEDEFIDNLEVYFDTKFDKYTKSRITGYLKEYAGKIPAPKPIVQIKEKKIVVFQKLDTKEIINEVGETVKIEPSVVIKHVSDYSGIAIKDILSRCRRRDFVIARHVCMYALRGLSGMHLVDIGKFMGGLDHTSVIHGLKKVKEMLFVEDEKYTNTFHYLNTKLFEVQKQTA